MATPAVQIPDDTTDKPLRPRRWIPLSLRMFACILVFLGIGSVLWFGIPAYGQYLAIQEVERLGGLADTSPRGPEWLHDLVGEERMRNFEEVVFVDFYPDEATFKNRAPAWALPHRPFVASGPTVDDTSLACVASFTNLRELNLRFTNVGDAGMEYVYRLDNLEALFLEGTDVSDASVDRLAKMKNLKRLYLNGRRVSEAGLARLAAALPGCKLDRAGYDGIEKRAD